MDATALSLHGSGGAGLFHSRFAGPVPVADAIPAALSTDGSSFTVTWQQRQPAAAPLPAGRAPPGEVAPGAGAGASRRARTLIERPVRADNR